MFWKNWPYWVRGGVVSGLLYFVLLIVIYIIHTQIQNPGHTDWMKLDYYPSFGKTLGALAFQPGVTIFLLLSFLLLALKIPLSKFPETYTSGGFFFGGHFTFFGSVLVIASSLIFYILIGAFFGWLYGKIKNRKMNQIL